VKIRSRVWHIDGQTSRRWLRRPKHSAVHVKMGPVLVAQFSIRYNGSLRRCDTGIRRIRQHAWWRHTSEVDKRGLFCSTNLYHSRQCGMYLIDAQIAQNVSNTAELWKKTSSAPSSAIISVPASILYAVSYLSDTEALLVTVALGLKQWIGYDCLARIMRLEW